MLLCSSILGDIDKISDYVLNGRAKHQAYKRLANFTDMWGPRVSGSQVLEDSISELNADRIIHLAEWTSYHFTFSNPPLKLIQCFLIFGNYGPDPIILL